MKGEAVGGFSAWACRLHSVIFPHSLDLLAFMCACDFLFVSLGTYVSLIFLLLNHVRISCR